MQRASGMQRAPQPAPRELQLPLMYIAPNRSLVYGYAYADDLCRFEDLRKSMAGQGVGMSLLYTYEDPQQKGFVGTFVLDVTDAQGGLDQVTRNVSNMTGLSGVQLGPVGCGLAAAEKNTLQVDGTPVVVFGRQLIGETYRRFAEAMGDQGAALLFEAGRAAGRQTASGVPSLVSSLGTQLSPELIRERFRDLQVFGWTDVALLQMHDSTSGEALLADDFEAIAWQGQARTSRCNWIRGFIAGALSTLVGKEIEVTEPECQAKGDQHCRMVFRVRTT